MESFVMADCMSFTGFRGELPNLVLSCYLNKKYDIADLPWQMCANKAWALGNQKQAKQFQYRLSTQLSD